MLVLICGLPNAGKTTYSSRYENVVHLDDFEHSVRSLYAQSHRCNIYASKCENDVCVEGVYGSIRQRKELIELCEHQTPKICIWLNTSEEECIRRGREYESRHPSIVISHAQSFRPPTLDEGWDEIICISN